MNTKSREIVSRNSTSYMIAFGLAMLKSKKYAVVDFEFSNNYSSDIILISGAMNKANRPSTEIVKFQGPPIKIQDRTMTNVTKYDVVKMLQLIDNIFSEKPLQWDILMEELFQGVMCRFPNLNRETISNELGCAKVIVV